MQQVELFERTRAEFIKLQSQGKHHYYPSRLKDSTVSLLSTYSVKVLSKAFQISEQSILKWQALKSPRNTSTGFIPLSLPEEYSASKPTRKRLSTKLELTLPGDLLLTLNTDSLPDTVSFLKSLSEEFSICSI